ncbi:MAG: 4Fe-4S binding protein [Methanobacterium sp.]|jgi:energy-converting hydrogenase A subunit Q
MIKIPETKTDKKSYKPLREVEVAYEIDASKCEQCIARPCLQVCPVEAVHEIPPDKHIEIDDKCFGCVLCREACPYDAIKMETTLAEAVRENIPNINPKLCRRCGACVDACRTGAVHLISSGKEEAHSVIDEEKCVKCGYCARVCPTEAIKFGEILPRSVAGGKAIVVDQEDCVGCMICRRVCPSKGAINVGKVSKLPYIDPSYCARCEECMDVCPSAAIKYTSRKKAYESFGKIKTMEIVSEILEKETKRLASDAGKVESILNRISLDLSYGNTDDEFEIDVTDRIKADIESAVDGDLDIEDLRDIVKATSPKRDVIVIEESCIGCTLCMNICPTSAIELEKPSPVHIGDECVYCGRCIEACPFEAISLKEEYFEARNGRIFYVRKGVEGPRTGEVTIDNESCQLCEVCVNKCPADAMSIEDNRVVVDREKCILCSACEVICPLNAVRLKT